MAGRSTLIKATFNTIHNHVIQIISIPSNIINRLEICQKKKLWGSTSQKRKLHLLNWKTVTSSKDNGGLGIQKLRGKNEALLSSTT